MLAFAYEPPDVTWPLPELADGAPVPLRPPPEEPELLLPELLLPELVLPELVLPGLPALELLVPERLDAELEPLV